MYIYCKIVLKVQVVEEKKILKIKIKMLKSYLFCPVDVAM